MKFLNALSYRWVAASSTATLFLLTALSSFGQTYYSQCSCNFATAANWNTLPGGGGSSPASMAGNSRTYIVQNGHSMTLTTDAGLGSTITVTVASGGSLAMTGTASFRGANSINALNISGSVSFITASASAALRSTLVVVLNGGTFTNQHPTAGQVAILTFRIHGGGLYVHNTGHATLPGSAARQFSNATNGGNGNGTVSIRNQGTTSVPGGIQWGHVIIDLVVDPGVAIDNFGRFASVAGDFTVLNTHGRAYRFTTNETNAHNIGGSLTVNHASAALILKGGTGIVPVTVMGNVNLNAGQLYLAASTGAGHLFVKGDFNFTGGTLNEASAGSDHVEFNGTAEQFYTRTGGTISNAVNFRIANGAIVNVGTSLINGAGTFTLVNGGTLKTANLAGLTSSGAIGSIQVTGTRNYGTLANFVYTGTSAQVTGNGLPASLNNLTASATGGLTLSASVIAAGNLAVTAGVFDIGSNTVPRATSGGSLTIANGAILRIGGTGTYPANYASHLLGATSTVEYYGTAQSVASRPYGHLILSGSGLKTLAGTTAIVGDLTVNAGPAFDLSTFDFSCNNALISAGATLNVNAATTFLVSGSTATLAGTLNAADNSTFSVSNGVSATLAITGTASFFDLTSNMTTGTTVTGGADIRGTLQLTDGVFNASGASVTLRSTAAGTGRLGPVAATASYTGSMKVERYIPAGATNWRFLGSPVSNNFIYHWQDDFITAGYPGSHFPNFDDPTGSNILWPSIRKYNENNTGTNMNDGLVGVSAHTEAIAQGRGYAAWSGDMLGGTAPFVIDMTGAPYVANTPISLPMSWTSTGTPAVDGWNMVSNPVASPIAFDQISRGSNVNDYVTYYDPATGNTATWDISLGSGTNGGTNTIQSSQGFWLKANGASVTTTVTEGDKVAGNTGGFFGGDEETTLELLRLKLTSGMNTYSDETVLVFNVGTPEIEDEDVHKMIFSLPAAPQIGTFGTSTQVLAMNAYGEYTTAASIPVMVDAGVSGTYTVTATGFENMGLRCLSLEDLLTGDVTLLTGGAAYSFEMDAEADASIPRLMLHATVPLSFEAVDALCSGMANGQATVVIADGPADVTWTDEFGAVLSQQTGVMEGDVTFGGLTAGSYMVHVTSNTACGELVSEFTIDAPFVLEGSTIASTATTCADAEDGSIDVMVLGGVEPYTYAWSNGTDTEDLTAGAGNYTLTVTDAHNCEWVSDVYTIDAGGVVAGFTVDNPVVLLNVDVIFSNTSVSGETFFWEFGDGTTSTEMEPVHAYTLPGTYTVTLTVTSASCSDATSFDVTVEMNTGISTSTSTASGVNAWTSSNGIVVEHGFTSGSVLIEVLDVTGSLHATHRAAGTPGRVVLPVDGLSTGIWFVRVTNGDQQQTFRLPLVR